MSVDHNYYMKRAYALAKKGYDEGGCPIGAVIIDENGDILGQGHNMLVQEGNPIIHGEMSAMRDAGRMLTRAQTTMYTTLSPCMMCAGTIVQFNIPHVVVGDTVNSAGNVDFLRERGVKVTVLDDPDCIALVERFREEKPELWLEDWGGPRCEHESDEGLAKKM
ncbi:MAG: nucleoside deaminase [Alphaproteobacteria bacterium]|nr:nucleoside deaminase [Alphaproteobacteria bacterium]